MSTGSTPALSRAPVPVSGEKMVPAKNWESRSTTGVHGIFYGISGPQMVNCVLISPGLFEETKQAQKQSQEVFGAVGRC